MKRGVSSSAELAILAAWDDERRKSSEMEALGKDHQV